MCGGFQVSGYLIAISANAGFTDLGFIVGQRTLDKAIIRFSK